MPLRGAIALAAAALAAAALAATTLTLAAVAAAAVVPALPATTLPFHSAATFAARSVPIAGTISTPLALRAAKDERDERLHRYCELERKDNPPMV